MSEIDQQFIEYVVKSLVGKPDAVKINRTIDEKGVLLELTVDPDDLGRVIGKRGATAQSLRTLLRALGTKNDARYNLKIIDNGDGSQAAGDDKSGRPVDDKPKKPKKDDQDDQGEPERPEEQAAEPADESEEQAAEPEEPEQDTATEAMPEDETGDRLARSRKELADLDDLDV